MSGPYATKPRAVNKNNPQMLRQCLGKFATGVTVVTCQGPDGPRGITANSFSSVSLDPPLILWSVGKESSSLQTYLDTERFAVNVLSAGQEALSIHFSQTQVASFDGIAYASNGSDVPILEDTLACFECRTHQILDAGDHYIIIGEVENHQESDGDPLVFFGGRYTTI